VDEVLGEARYEVAALIHTGMMCATTIVTEWLWLHVTHEVLAGMR
jgi:hypothetical protein